jgi:hypothetical protein
MLHSPIRRVALPRWIDLTVGWFVRDTRPLDEQRTCRVVVGFTLTCLAWSPLYALFYQRSFRRRMRASRSRAWPSARR